MIWSDRVNSTSSQKLIPLDAESCCRVTDVRVEYGKAAEVITSVAESECASLIVIGLRAHVLGDHAPWSTVAQVTAKSKPPYLASEAITLDLNFCIARSVCFVFG